MSYIAQLSFSSCQPLTYSLCAVVVVKGPPLTDVSLYDNASPFTEDFDFYITAAWGEEDIYRDGVPERLTIGDGGGYIANRIQYINAPLDSDTMYTIIIRYDIRSDTSDTVSPIAAKTWMVLRKCLCSFFSP